MALVGHSCPEVCKPKRAEKVAARKCVSPPHQFHEHRAVQESVRAAPFLAVWGAVQGDAGSPVKPRLAYAGMYNMDVSLQI